MCGLQKYAPTHQFLQVNSEEFKIEHAVEERSRACQVTVSIEVNEEINHHDEMPQNMRHNRSFQIFHKCRGYFFIKSVLIQNGYWSLFFSTKLNSNNH